MPDKYSSQYREMVLVQVRAGRSVYDLAEGLEVSAATIFRWKRQDQIDAGDTPGLSSQDHNAERDDHWYADQGNLADSRNSSEPPAEPVAPRSGQQRSGGDPTK